MTWTLTTHGIDLYGRFAYTCGKLQRDLATPGQWLELLVMNKEAPVEEIGDSVVFAGTVIAIRNKD